MCNDVSKLFLNMGILTVSGIWDALSLVLDSEVLIFCHMQSCFIIFTNTVEPQSLAFLPGSILDPVFTCSVMTSITDGTAMNHAQRHYTVKPLGLCFYFCCLN